MPRRELVILGERAAPVPGCLVIDAYLLRRTGALAVWAGPEGLRLVTAAEVQGRRLWSRHRGAVPVMRMPEAVPAQLALR